METTMQDRYAGDIGDYIKLGIIRSLSAGRDVGVAWWLYPDESHNSDGRHIAYLNEPSKWRSSDPVLFDGLKGIVSQGERNVGAIEKSALLPGAIYFNELIPTLGTPVDRRSERQRWFAKLQNKFRECSFVFVDPDNGLETKGFSLGNAKAGKSVSLDEIAALRKAGRTLVVYHHQTRMKGGAVAELAYWGDKLKAAGFERVDALYSKAISCRYFFLLDADAETRRTAELMTKNWAKLEWRSALGSN